MTLGGGHAFESSISAGRGVCSAQVSVESELRVTEESRTCELFSLLSSSDVWWWPAWGGAVLGSLQDEVKAMVTAILCAASGGSQLPHPSTTVTHPITLINYPNLCI